jgi:predicted metalloprotease
MLNFTNPPSGQQRSGAMKLRITTIAVGLALLAACGSTTAGVTARGAAPIDETADSTTKTAPTTTTDESEDTTEDTAPETTTRGTTATTTKGTSPGTAPRTTPGTVDTGAPATATGSTDTIPAKAPTFDFGTGKTPQAYDAKLQVEIDDIQAFWTNEFPKVFGKPYVPLTGKIFAGFPGRTDIPGCGTKTAVYEKDIKNNAFYCGNGDFVAYDDASLFPALSKRLGDISLGVVLAHEWGHAIQQRANVPGRTPTITLEQQADCYAGTWSAHLARGENKALAFSDAEIKNALLALILVKDPAGADSNDPNAHGSAFDRVGAFQDGFTNGAKKCSTYIATPPKTLELPGDASFQANGGNAPLDDPDKPVLPDPNDKTKNVGIYGLLISDLPTFWTAQLAAGNVKFSPPKLVGYDTKGPFPTCSTTKDFASKPYVFCPDDNTLYFNRTIGTKFYNDFGDFAIGYLLSNGYGDAVQTALGSKLTNAKRALLNDCLTGAYAANAAPLGPSTAVNIQAGDLDEAVETAVSIGDNKSTDNIIGTGFQKIAAFRNGVLGGLSACNQQIAAA